MAAAGFQTLRPTLAIGYNLGRITTYGVLGLLFGSVTATLPAQALPVLMILSAALLALTALYLVGFSNLITHVEKIGLPIWRQTNKLSKTLLPIRRFPSAFALGLLWGLIPCGLVYTALAFSLSTGSGLNALLAMLTFGLGTFPTMLGTALAANRMRSVLNVAWVKYLLASVMLILSIQLVGQVFGFGVII